MKWQTLGLSRFDATVNKIIALGRSIIELLDKVVATIETISLFHFPLTIVRGELSHLFNSWAFIEGKKSDNKLETLNPIKLVL